MNNYQCIYICDGTIEGMLSCVYESYYSKDNVFDIIFAETVQVNFTYEYKHIKTNFDNAQKVAFAIKTKISKLAFDNIVNVWLSESRLSGHHIIEYIRLGFEKGRDIYDMLTQENVAYIQRINQKVEVEVHRFLGICRFSKMEDNTYLAVISPDNNILSLLAEHFASRLCSEKLVLYDEKRKYAILSDRGEWIIVNNVLIKANNFNNDEFVFREMWQRYFKAIAIKERTNKKLQRSFIPTRYWDNITELKSK